MVEGSTKKVISHFFPEFPKCRYTEIEEGVYIMFIKAEILLTRKCSIGCDYCRMRRDTNFQMPIEEWDKVLCKLRDWDVKFLAIYGAEPTEYPHFIEFMRLVNRYGWGKSNSVITAGHHPKVLEAAWDEGLLDSLTVSWDFNRTGKDNLADKICERFLGRVSDLELSATIFPDTTVNDIDILAMKAYLYDAWISFDLMHCDPFNHEWSKVPNGEKRVAVNDAVIQHLMRLAVNHRVKVHQTVRAMAQCLSEFDLWNCSYPYFLTVNCDGSPMICDDYGYSGKKLYDFTEEEFRAWWGVVAPTCPGCKWTTHFMSEELFNQKGVDHFVHGRR